MNGQEFESWKKNEKKYKAIVIDPSWKPQSKIKLVMDTKWSFQM